MPVAGERRKRGALAVALWLAASAIALGVALRSHYVADLSAFLPAAPTPEQAVLLDQLKDGAASRLVLIGIEGGSSTGRADASRRLADALRASGLFASVNNGDTAAWQDAGRFVFAHRYALSPAVDAARFSVDGLRAAIDDTLSLLGTPAGSLVKPILFRDPTGETLRIVEALTPAQAPRSEDGVWVSRTAPRAVLLATTAAAGGDLDAQQAALVAVHQAFAKVASPSLRLLVSGSASFGVASRERIKSEVERLATLGLGAMVVLLLLAFASLRSLAIALLPVATGVLAGIAAVSLVFGQVHGMTLGFGTTLIGEAIDYAIYYLIQAGAARSIASTSPDALPRHAQWLRASWPTVRLGLFTSLVGFAALVFSGFPGLSQLGVFSIAGLAAAAATTRFVFPVLAPDGAPGIGLRRGVGRFMTRAVALLARLRVPFAIVGCASVVAIVLVPSPWHGDLQALSPIAPADLALDASLRSDVGAPDAGTLVAVSAADEAHVLEAAEAVGTRLDALVARGDLQGYDSPARLLPSPRTQAARIAALPDAATLGARLSAATEGGALSASRLAPFIADVEAARTLRPFDRAALSGTSLAAAVDAMLLHGDGTRSWRALVNLQLPAGGSLDAARLRAAIAGVPGARLVAIKPELDALYAQYLHRAGWQAGVGALAVVVLLGWHLRSARRLLAVCVSVAAATLVVLAALALGKSALGILHLVGLLLTVAIGSNYALFFEHLRQPRDDAVDDADTLASLLLANLTAVASFGFLATSHIPVLQAIGEVVAPGALLCLVFSAAFLARPAGVGAYGKIPAP